MIDALLLSTRPASSPIPCANPKSMSVGTFDAFFGQATQSRPDVSSAAASRSNHRISSVLLGGEQHADVEWLRELRQEFRGRRASG